MLIKISEHCNNCGWNDRGSIVDASVNSNIGVYPAAVYIDGEGMTWNFDNRSDFEIMNVIPANVTGEY